MPRLINGTHEEIHRFIAMHSRNRDHTKMVWFMKPYSPARWYVSALREAWLPSLYLGERLSVVVERGFPSENATIFHILSVDSGTAPMRLCPNRETISGFEVTTCPPAEAVISGDHTDHTTPDWDLSPSIPPLRPSSLVGLFVSGPPTVC